MRIEQLTFTRFIAAVSIVIFHYGKDSYLFNNQYLSFIFKQANIGVSYFFILSGFVMIIAYGNRDKINFYDYLINRFARIYPVYLLALILYLAINLFKEINISELVLNLLMLQAWIPSKALTLNYTGWSLSVELFFYIAFPFLFNFFYKKNNLKIIFIWIVSFWLLSQILYHLILQNNIENYTFYESEDVFYNPLMHFNEFLIGNLAGLYFISNLKDLKKNYFIQIILIISLLILLLKFPLGFSYHNGLLGIIFVPMIFLISISTDKLTMLFKKSFFVFLGEISFGIYILQAPIWFIFSDFRLNKLLGFDKEKDFTLSFMIRLIILILVSSASYLYFEKPLRNKIKNLGI